MTFDFHCCPDEHTLRGLNALIGPCEVDVRELDRLLLGDAIESMLAGNEPDKSGVDRERLAVGDSFPAVILPDQRTGKPMELAARGDRLVFRDHTGTETPIAGAVGFFSRY